MSAMVS
jgi:hypothetical protein